MKRHGHITIKSLLFAIIYILLIKPAYITSIPLLNTTWNYLQLIPAIFSIYIILRRKLTKPTYLVIGLYSVFVVSRIVNGNFDIYYIFQIIPYVVLPVLCDYWIDVYGSRSIVILYKVLFCYLFLNFVSIVFFPDGLYTAESIAG